MQPKAPGLQKGQAEKRPVKLCQRSMLSMDMVTPSSEAKLSQGQRATKSGCSVMAGSLVSSMGSAAPLLLYNSGVAECDLGLLPRVGVIQEHGQSPSLFGNLMIMYFCKHCSNFWCLWLICFMVYMYLKQVDKGHYLFFLGNYAI